MKGGLLTVVFTVLSATTGLVVYNEYFATPYCTEKDLSKIPPGFFAKSYMRFDGRNNPGIPMHCQRFIEQQIKITNKTA